MAVVKRPFISESGFQSTGFSVDTAGNVTVRTITNTYTPPAPAVVPDFNVEETAGAFTWKKDGTAVAGVNAGVFTVATELDGTVLGATASVDAGETFLVPIDTSTDCTPQVGDNQEMRVFIDGGGDTYASLHYNDVNPGSSII